MALPEPHELITPKQAAAILKCDDKTIYNWIHTGRLKAWRRGINRYLIRRVDVEAMMVPVEAVMREVKEGER